MPCFLPLILAASSLLCLSGIVDAQVPEPVTQLPRIEVISAAPLPGIGVPKDQLPANVQSATSAVIERGHALDLTDFMNRSLGSVSINALQNNPFQPDVNFRGFTASPLLGTPQGISVFLDGVRLNQPFGDVVSWDLIPRSAIASVVLNPGSDPLFGLNTLGGALSIQTKDGLKNPGNSVQVQAGSHHRSAIEFESGGSMPSGLNWFVTGNRFHERGWRDASPSDLNQLFAKIGAHDPDSEFSLTTAFANNDLTGNGTQEQSALSRDAASVYTRPDNTRNRSLLMNLMARRDVDASTVFSAHTYYRRIDTRTTNGNVNGSALSESLYQPNGAEQAALGRAGFTDFPKAGASAANTPFPKWRCIADALLNSEPDKKCDGIVDRSATHQYSYGFAAQLEKTLKTAGMSHRFLGGLAYDANRVGFEQSTQYGFINPDRSVTPVSAFADGTQGSDDAPDSRVVLSSRAHTASIYASETTTIDSRTHVTWSGRYNRNVVSNVDGLKPGGGAGSLDGHYTFSHFNPAVGLTFSPGRTLTLYAGLSRGSRAPSAIELGCADPQSPCKLPNSFASDPPLRQVVTTTIEAGARGVAARQWTWNAGVFRSDSHDDLLFVSGHASGFGYFKNFGETRRQGLEAGLSSQPAKGWTVGTNITLLDATYRTAETVDGSSNSSNDSAAAGFPGTEGRIRISPGNRIPLLPRRILKLYTDWDISAQWSVGADLVATSGAIARGNENGQHQPDGVYYTGPGRSKGYAVLNLNADHRPTRSIKLFVHIDNVLGRRYATAAQLAANAFDANGRIVARPLPQNANGDYPVGGATFLAPGAPRSVTLGARYTFD